MDELSIFRQAILALPNQSLVEAAIEAIELYERELPGFTDPFDLLEMCARAIADIHHEVAIVKYGFESPEAEAVFDEGERIIGMLEGNLGCEGGVGEEPPDVLLWTAPPSHWSSTWHRQCILGMANIIR